MAEGSDYIEIAITTGSEPERDILVARLSEMGFEGFEEDRNVLKAFIPANDFDDQLLDSFFKESGLQYITSVIKYKNWNEEWEAGFEPVLIGDFCSVRALFHPAVNTIKHDIIITPKMSFGTGHHATTYLMIEAMQQITVKGKTVFDFGTGTGVLAILAEKMGAALIEAIDLDDWSIENGKENLLQNQCEKIRLYKSDEITTSLKFDLILANINRNVILEHLTAMKERLQPEGRIVVSGLLTGDADRIIEEATRQNLVFESNHERNGWICLQFTNRQD